MSLCGRGYGPAYTPREMRQMVISEFAGWLQAHTSKAARRLAPEWRRPAWRPTSPAATQREKPCCPPRQRAGIPLVAERTLGQNVAGGLRPMAGQRRGDQTSTGRYQASSPSLRAELEADDLWRSWVEWLQETADHGAGSGWARILD